MQWKLDVQNSPEKKPVIECYSDEVDKTCDENSASMKLYDENLQVASLTVKRLIFLPPPSISGEEFCLPDKTLAECK